MSVFRFKHFEVQQTNSAMKIGTDAMLLGATVSVENHANVLDIGAGTGVLALMLAQRNLDLHIEAIEIENDSFKDLEFNIINSPWSNRLTAIHDNVLTWPNSKQYDLIVTNPPYYENSLKNPDAGRALARHESHLPFDLLFNKVDKLLTEDGNFWMIFPFENLDRVVLLAAQNNLHPSNIIQINGKPEVPARWIVCFSRNKEKIVSMNNFTIRNHDGGYTDDYKLLTKNYHGVKL